MVRLLFVDSDPRSLNVLGVGLRQSGYDVTTTADSTEALASIDAAAPELVISASRLHKVDGYEFVRRLRERPETATLPVILIVNDESAAERARACELGVEDTVKKPVFVRELVARVQLVLARRIQEYVVDGPKLGCARLVGSTRHLAVVDLVQTFESAGRSGVVRLRSGEEEALLYFRDGRLVDAELGHLRGEEAAYRAFVWYDASFEVELRPHDKKDSVGCSTQTVVRKGMQRVDQWLRPPAPPASTDHRGPVAFDSSLDVHQALATRGAADAASSAGQTAAVATADLPSALPRSETHRAEMRGRAVSSRPSSAPWTREIDQAAGTSLDDAELAGLPRMRRASRRFVAATMALATLLVVVGGLRSWQRRAQGAQVPATSTEVAAGGAAAVATDMALSATSPARMEEQREQPDPGAPVENQVENQAPVAGQGVEVASSANPEQPAPEVVTGPAKEMPIDVKLIGGGQSPLVRDAEQALLQGQTERALALAQQAVAKTPTDADSWLTLAAAQKASGDVTAAGETYRKCTEHARTVGLDHCRTLANRP